MRSETLGEFGDALEKLLDEAMRQAHALDASLQTIIKEATDLAAEAAKIEKKVVALLQDYTALKKQDEEIRRILEVNR